MIWIMDSKKYGKTKQTRVANSFKTPYHLATSATAMSFVKKPGIKLNELLWKLLLTFRVKSHASQYITKYRRRFL